MKHIFKSLLIRPYFRDILSEGKFLIISLSENEICCYPIVQKLVMNITYAFNNIEKYGIPFILKFINSNRDIARELHDIFNETSERIEIFKPDNFNRLFKRQVVINPSYF